MAKDNQYGFFRDILLTDGALNVNVVNGTLFSYTATNYTDLLTKIDMSEGDLSYVYDSQGTAWLPGIVGGDYYPNGIYVYSGSNWASDRNAIAIQLQENTYEYQIRVTQQNVASTLGGIIDSTKDYFIDGIINCTGVSITVPASGMSLKGHSFNISKLICADLSYTMFISPLGGSGDVLFTDMAIEVTGSNSKVFDLTDSTGFHAIESARVNYNECNSLGDLYNYRQGLEDGTGRFGGSPSLTLHGLWRGGFRVTTSIVRNMSDTTTEPLFKVGNLFQMNSRFLTDINVDLGTLQPLLDFSDINFPNPSTLELRDALVTRNGIISPNDPNITPNIEASNLSCSWKGNNGIGNTFVGAIATVITEITTVITGGNPSILAGTVINTDLQHFDSPSNGQLRHLGDNPREYTVNFDFVLDGGPNDDYRIELVRNDGVDTVVYGQIRVINNLSGGRDVGYFTGLANIILNKNEYVFWRVRNLTDNTNCTLELGSSWSVEER